MTEFKFSGELFLLKSLWNPQDLLSALNHIPKPVFNVFFYRTHKFCSLSFSLNTSENVLCFHKEQANKLSAAHTHTQLREQMRLKFPRYLATFSPPASRVTISLPETQRWPSSAGMCACVCLSAPTPHSPLSREYCGIVRSDSQAEQYTSLKH